MNKEGLKLSLDVVEQGHKHSKFLVESHFWVTPIYLFSQENEQESDCNWTTILNQEDCPPGDLGAQILEVQSDMVQLNIVLEHLTLITECNTFWPINGQTYSGVGKSFLLYRQEER